VLDSLSRAGTEWGEAHRRMKGYQDFSYHVADEAPRTQLSDETLREMTFRGARAESPSPIDVDPEFTSVEAAARFHLNRILKDDDRPIMRGIIAPESAELVPGLRHIDTLEVPQTRTLLTRFDQLHEQIPVFGTRAICELTRDNAFVSAQGFLGSVDELSPIASMSPAGALDSIAALTKVEAALIGSPQCVLRFYLSQETDEWHLAYLLTEVPAAPKELVERARGHGLDPSPRELEPLVNYLVDAHTGEVLFFYSAVPMLDIPTLSKGLGEDGEVEFWTTQDEDEYEMRDPLRSLVTYDLNLKDLDSSFPTEPVRSPQWDWEQTNKAAVSAHANATKVYNFFKSVLLRDGIDDKGMELVNVVNCTYGPSPDEPHVWRNAVWYQNRMWYGQATVGNGDTLVSYSRFLDVIAHELTHGLTKFTADLIYRDQSGALNESMSDIFGVIVKNWDWTRADGGVTSSWNWELGSGLGESGRPLRDLSDPPKTGDPDHMRDYLVTTDDSGGVHTNSNIHNKAAYRLLTAVDANSDPVLSPQAVSTLYYLTLTRLGAAASFPDVLKTLTEVARSYFGDPALRERAIAAIEEAYSSVGIGRE
jgi:bacillolysin